MADLKLVYRASSKELAEHHLLELDEKWGQPMHNWALIISQLHIYFEGRLALGLK